MSVLLLAPLGLAALAALGVPILLHLVRRSQATRIEFAALRWVPERIKARRRVRLEQPWLLLLRLLLLVLLALLLACPAWIADSDADSAWVVVAPGVSPTLARQRLKLDDARWRWLAPGFPALADTPPRTQAVPVASLLRELDATLAPEQSLHVLVPEVLEGMDGERPVLAHEVDWQVVPGAMPKAARPAPSPIRIAARIDAADIATLRLLEAVVDDWNRDPAAHYQLVVQDPSAAIDATSDWAFWFAAGDAGLDRWLHAGGRALVLGEVDTEDDPLWRDAQGNVLTRIRVVGAGRRISLPARFTPADLPILLEPDFPQRLHDVLADPSVAPARADANALRPRADHAIVTAAAVDPAAAHPLDAWLALLIATVFLLERWLALRLQRGAPA